MGWFGRKDAAPEVKASATARLTAPAGGRVVWGPRDAGALTRMGYLGNPVGFRAVRLIAEATGALPVVCMSGEERMETHPALALLSRPNPGQARAELMEALVSQTLLSGDGYVEGVSGADGAPAELHVLRSDRVSVVPGEDGWPVAYEYAVGARKVRLPGAAVCHVRGFHPQDDHYGLSPMQAAAAAVEVHNAASRPARPP